jgi:hypothetical protein
MENAIEGSLGCKIREDIIIRAEADVLLKVHITFGICIDSVDVNH